MRYSVAYAVTPHDTDPSIRVNDVTDGLYIGTGGTLRVTMSDGKVVNFAAVAAGVLPLAVTKVHASGTSATGIVALKS